VMAQLGHADPGFTLRAHAHAHAMRRDAGDKERLKALVEGRAGPARADERERAEPENDETPANAGRGVARCDSPLAGPPAWARSLGRASVEAAG
jgi:hypothetical protein